MNALTLSAKSPKYRRCYWNHLLSKQTPSDWQNVFISNWRGVRPLSPSRSSFSFQQTLKCWMHWMNRSQLHYLLGKLLKTRFFRWDEFRCWKPICWGSSSMYSMKLPFTVGFISVVLFQIKFGHYLKLFHVGCFKNLGKVCSNWLNGRDILPGRP